MGNALKDKVALVAGATRGAGRGIAVELGAAGATVYVTGRTTRLQRSEYNGTHYRLALFYDLAKTSVIRLAWAQAQELQPYQCTAVALTPGWLRSEMMLDHYGVSEANWRDALAQDPGFAISETPHYVGRAVASLAGDAGVGRFNGQSLSSGQLARVYGFTDLDGSQPDCWRYIRQVREAGLPADVSGYR
jgi:NAD(P)-dependent dehydrogenase (short-subunit alcohol dehydrogenase family)